MRKFICFIILILFSVEYGFAQGAVRLPAPEIDGDVSVERAIQNRRSVRRFTGLPVNLKQVSQLLWAAGGITIDGVSGPTRAYPSAGGIYPLVLYLVAGNVNDLASGVYKYSPFSNSLLFIKNGDLRTQLSNAALGQKMIRQAPASIVIVALYDKTVNRYGKRGFDRYISMDAGHSAQNVHLQAYSLGLGACMVGAFNDAKVNKIIGAESGTPVYIIPVGGYKGTEYNGPVENN